MPTAFALIQYVVAADRAVWRVVLALTAARLRAVARRLRRPFLERPPRSHRLRRDIGLGTGHDSMRMLNRCARFRP